MVNIEGQLSCSFPRVMTTLFVFLDFALANLVRVCMASLLDTPMNRYIIIVVTFTCLLYELGPLSGVLCLLQPIIFGCRNI